MSPASTPAPIAETLTVAATPDQVWAVVGDPRRMPELSPELRKVFVRGTPGLGSTIVGLNRRGVVVWPTTSKVVRWEPGRAVAWRTRESGATWVYELEPVEGGTRISARRVLPRFTLGTSLMAPVIGGAAGHDRELAQGLRTTLERIKRVVEG